VLAAYLHDAEKPIPHTFIVHAGDMVGGSPAISGMLADEPTIEFLNQLAESRCQGPSRSGCNMVGTLGNHEFGRGTQELLRLIYGDRTGPEGFQGVRFPVVCSNVFYKGSGKPLLRPYNVEEVEGVKIAFIGAVTTETPVVNTASHVGGLEFRDEASSVNAVIPEAKKEGANVIIVLIHEGGSQDKYDGPTKPDAPPVTGQIPGIVSRLNGDVDVVVAGHYHLFTNAFLPSLDPSKKILVTQAWAHGLDFAQIDLLIDRQTKMVISKTATIVPTWWDGVPNNNPDRAAMLLVEKATQRVPKAKETIGEASVPIDRDTDRTGQSRLGNFVADALRETAQTNFAFVNGGGLGDEIPKGAVTWGHLYASQPYRNDIVRMTLTGAQVKRALLHGAGYLFVSGLSYTWSRKAHRVDHIRVGPAENNEELDDNKPYTVATSDYMAGGGDAKFTFTMGKDTATLTHEELALPEDVLASLLSFVTGKDVSKPTRSDRMLPVKDFEAVIAHFKRLADVEGKHQRPVFPPALDRIRIQD
jgi:5'-nucleotidase